MGEIADLMLQGVFCEGCGELMDDLETFIDEEGAMMIDLDSAAGHPQRCSCCSGANDD